MSFITGFGPLLAKLIAITLGKLQTSVSDGFIGDGDTAIEHHFFNISEAQGESVVEPHTVADDFGREAMATVGITHLLNFSATAAQCQSPLT